MKTRLWRTLGVPLAAGLVTIWFGTLRVEIAAGRDIYLDHFVHRRFGHVIAGMWHRSALFFCYFFRKLDRTVMMVSPSRDGDFLAQVAERFGYRCVRGSSTRGGFSALRDLIREMKSETRPALAGTAMDGPQGPARIFKPGMLVAAKMTEAWFVPITWSTERPIVFRKSWDHTMLPRPFSKVVVMFDRPFKIPRHADEQELEKLRLQAEMRLNGMTDQADGQCGYPDEAVRGPRP